MGLGNINEVQEKATNKKWLSIHHGKVELSENGSKSLYDFIEGSLISIHREKRTYSGESVLKWFIDLQDEEGTVYSIGFPYSSGTFVSIVLSLASYKDLNSATEIRIKPYQKGNFTNVVVYANGSKLDWVTKNLPPIATVEVAGKRVKDDSERMRFVTNYALTVDAKAKRGN